MTISDPPASLYDQADRLITIHEALLRDKRRNRPFCRALKKNVTPDSSVLDIGSGTGLWAITAARLGARRVVAVEREPLLIGLIKTLARENGVADRIEVVQGDSRDLQLGKDFDIVVSETIGHVIFDEQVTEIMLDARRRFLRPGGLLVPDTVSLRAVPAHLRYRDDRLPAGMAGEFKHFESLLLHSPLPLSNKKRLDAIGAPQDLVRVDLRSAAAAPSVADMKACWREQDTTRVNCFAVWVEATLGGGVAVTTIETASWSATAYRIRPFLSGRGDLEFTLTLTQETNYWTASLVAGQQREVRSYSPATAAAMLLAASRTDADVFALEQRFGRPYVAPCR
jgi:predicted RNA methylase